jgi:hypothetical protein
MAEPHYMPRFGRKLAVRWWPSQEGPEQGGERGAGGTKAHYRKQSIHRESRASPRVKTPALGEASLRREHMVLLSAKGWPTVKSPFAESFLLSALGEGFSCWRHRRNRNGRLRSLNSPRARRTWLSAKKNTRRRGTFTESIKSSVSVLCLLTANFPKKLHIF